MKKIIVSFLAGVFCISAQAQNDYTKRPTLAIHYVLNDFKTAKDIRTLGLTKVVDAKQWSKVRLMDPGAALSYIQGLSNHLDLAATLSASFLNYQVPSTSIVDNQSHLFLEAAATANLKLLTDKYYVNPFLTAGIGASKYKGYYGAFVPVGLGLQIKVVEDNYALLNAQYRIPVSDNAEYHLYYSFGFAHTLTPKPEPVAVTPPMPVVTDRDGDGIADADDKCPDVAGLAKYNGCPIPDTDKDGINDEEDKCPTVPGVARYQGCPIPDTDGDGVNDEEDKCPSRPGPVSNQGCPEIAKEVIEKVNYAAKNVFFATGSYKLLSKSYKALNDVATLMKADESLMLDVDGHTDDVGSEESNQVLSENRAKAVKDYLISKGVSADRLFATGYGETKPVADNKTAAGRAKNRRTEMTARNF